MMSSVAYLQTEVLMSGYLPAKLGQLFAQGLCTDWTKALVDYLLLQR
jgi:hypothetical protein